MCVCGVSRNDESTWFVRVGSGSLPLSLGQDAISRGYMTGDALAQTSLSRFYDNVVYSITQCSRRQHVHTVFVWMYSLLSQTYVYAYMCYQL